MSKTYYELLGVPENATNAEIEAAFRSRASEVHPDRVSADRAYLKSVAAEAFKNLSEAKTVLLDPGKRQKYDEELARSRGSSATQHGASAGAPDADFQTSTPPAGTSDRARRAPNARVGFAIGAISACAVLLLAGLSLSRLSSPPFLKESPAAAPAIGSAPAQPPGSAGNPAATRKKTREPAKAGNGAAHPSASSRGGPQSLTLWRASQPPDLSRLSSSDRLNIESACSYAKLESQDEYNGCLVQQLAVQRTTPPPPDLSTLPASQREAIESACASTKLMQGPVAYNQCVAQRLELSKRRAP